MVILNNENNENKSIGIKPYIDQILTLEKIVAELKYENALLKKQIQKIQKYIKES